ncbi:hypothetical protein ACJX0J_008297, partial [Zea mays]
LMHIGGKKGVLVPDTDILQQLIKNMYITIGGQIQVHLYSIDSPIRNMPYKNKLKMIDFLNPYQGKDFYSFIDKKEQMLVEVSMSIMLTITNLVEKNKTICMYYPCLIIAQ